MHEDSNYQLTWILILTWSSTEIEEEIDQTNAAPRVPHKSSLVVVMRSFGLSSFDKSCSLGSLNSLLRLNTSSLVSSLQLAVKTSWIRSEVHLTWQQYDYRPWSFIANSALHRVPECRGLKALFPYELSRVRWYCKSQWRCSTTHNNQRLTNLIWPLAVL